MSPLSRAVSRSCTRGHEGSQPCDLGLGMQIDPQLQGLERLAETEHAGKIANDTQATFERAHRSLDVRPQRGDNAQNKLIGSALRGPSLAVWLLTTFLGVPMERWWCTSAPPEQAVTLATSRRARKAYVHGFFCSELPAGRRGTSPRLSKLLRMFGFGNIGSLRRPGACPARVLGGLADPVGGGGGAARSGVGSAMRRDSPPRTPPRTPEESLRQFVQMLRRQDGLKLLLSQMPEGSTLRDAYRLRKKLHQLRRRPCSFLDEEYGIVRDSSGAPRET